MIEFKIEKNVPIPFGRGNSAWRPFIETLDKLLVGESFLSNEKITKTANIVMHWRRRNRDKQVICKTVGDAVRIWRVK